MRRLIRVLFNVSAVSSLALGAAVACLWLRSYRAGDSLTMFWDVRESPGREMPDGGFLGGSSSYRVGYAFSYRGHFGVGVSDGGGPPEEIPEWTVTRRGYEGDPSAPQPAWEVGPATPSAEHPGFPPTCRVRGSYAIPLAAAAVLPAWAGVRWRRRRVRQRRVTAGRCAACEYDLRETPARCPECGAVTNR